MISILDQMFGVDLGVLMKFNIREASGLCKSDLAGCLSRVALATAKEKAGAAVPPRPKTMLTL
ncbi:hypothetical protein LJE98_19045 [Rhizobium ipomoeae]|nr:hypothetical protein [Rhizobium sp. 'Codium 1']